MNSMQQGSAVRRQRGVSIVEAMVALAIMGFGMLAVVGIQATMRLNADVAKQRSEATRFAQEEMETLRAFTVIDTTAQQRSWSEHVVASAARDVRSDDVAINTTYRISRTVAEYANPPAKALTVTVAWRDRADQEQQVVLRSVIAAATPALSGTLAVRPGTAAVGPVRRPLNRHPSIPVLARDFGNGKSGFVLPDRWGRTILVFNNVSGTITGICELDEHEDDVNNDTLTPSHVQSCDNNTSAQLLTGFVRSIRDPSGPDLTAFDVEQPVGPALRQEMQLHLTSNGHPNGTFCVDDANWYTTFSGELKFATYYCVIKSNSGGLWSGRLDVQELPNNSPSGVIDWRIRAGSAGELDQPNFRVCRYTPATSDSQPVENRDHPRNYTAVGGNLTNQNFVLIPGNKRCPTDVAANSASGDFVNSNTLQHQPDPN